MAGESDHNGQDASVELERVRLRSAAELEIVRLEATRKMEQQRIEFAANIESVKIEFQAALDSTLELFRSTKNGRAEFHARGGDFEWCGGVSYSRACGAVADARRNE